MTDEVGAVRIFGGSGAPDLFTRPHISYWKPSGALGPKISSQMYGAKFINARKPPISPPKRKFRA